MLLLCYLNRKPQKFVHSRNYKHLEPQKIVPPNHEKLPIRKIKLPKIFLLHGITILSRFFATAARDSIYGPLDCDIVVLRADFRRSRPPSSLAGAAQSPMGSVTSVIWFSDPSFLGYQDWNRNSAQFFVSVHTRLRLVLSRPSSLFKAFS